MKPATHLGSLVFATVSLVHLLRIAFGTQATLGDRVIPMWISWIAFLGAGALAVLLWREARQKA